MTIATTLIGRLPRGPLLTRLSRSSLGRLDADMQNGRSSDVSGRSRAEGVGFEPTMAVNHTRFRDGRIRPGYATPPGDVRRHVPNDQTSIAKLTRDPSITHSLSAYLVPSRVATAQR